MIKLKLYILSIPFLFSCTETKVVVSEIIPSSTIMYMDAPAKEWNEATPIGNGRLGGMIFGGTTKEVIKTNDDTFWSGEPRDLQKEGAHTYMPQIRQLILDGKHIEAQKLVNNNLIGPWNQGYLPLADIILHFEGEENEVSNYRRELDLNRGVVTITYTKKEINYKREIFASYPNQAIVIRLTADKENAFNFSASLNSLIRSKTTATGNQVTIKGCAPMHNEPHYEVETSPTYKEGRGIRFESRLLVRQVDGEIKTDSSKVIVKDASSATLLYVAATSFNGFDKDPFKEGKDENRLCDNYLSHIEKESYQSLYDSHLKDYSALFSRVSLNLGDSEKSILPINYRIQNYKPESDPSLTALYFQFGRYLLISSSRPGSQPANLQGIWNKDIQPGWCSNWTINCNTQINYWPAEATNLSECHQPLFDMIRETTVDGAKTAKNLYNSRGWVAHHNLDIWRTTWLVGNTYKNKDGVGGECSLYQVGSAWLCQHIWDHYLYTLDNKFLLDNYEILKGASLFYIDNLQKDKEGYLVTSPALSFENRYCKSNGEIGWICMGPAQDMQIIRALFKNTIQAAEIVGDPQFKEEVLKSYNRLAPMKISPRTGQLQEWNEDWDPLTIENAQMPQNWAFSVGGQISLRETPELAHALRKTFEHRRPDYKFNTGSWMGAYPAVCWARFEEPDSVQRVLNRHFDLAVSPNLTCNFFGYWQVDGNLGLTAAITEMLLQSHAGEINLLPALPDKYPTGSVKGLKARGDCEVSIAWKDNKLTTATLLSKTGGDVIVRYKDKTKTICLKPNKRTTINAPFE